MKKPRSTPPEMGAESTRARRPPTSGLKANGQGSAEQVRPAGPPGVRVAPPRDPDVLSTSKFKAPGTHDPELRPRKQMPEIYYEDKALVYWFRDADGFTRMNDSAIRQHLLIGGFSKASTSSLASEIDQIVANIRLTKKVDYVGRLAGYPVGYWQVYGRRLLITREAKLTNPADTGNTTIQDFFVKLLGPEQADVLFSWTKLAVEARREGIKRLQEGKPPNFRAGQYLGIAGDTSQGKTVGSRLLVWTISSLDEMKGDLSQFHKGQTTFNADGARHETHVIDDEGGSDSATGRREMLESIKKGTGQQEKRVHGKGQDGETFELFNRTIILLNRGIADLRILPEIEDDAVAQKIHLLKSVACAVDCDTEDLGDYNRYFDRLRAAIPDFIQFLERFTVPEELRGGRFGMRAYHHPELLRDLGELSETSAFWEVLDAALAEESWIGTAGQLYGYLLERDYSRRVMTLAKNSAAFGKIVHAAAAQSERSPNPARQIRKLGRSHGSAERFEIIIPRTEQVEP